MDMMYVEDCCEILDSMRVPITASDREEGEYPYYGANGIQDHVADYIFDDELVLLAEDGGNFGSKERPIAYRVSGKCWVNNHAHVLKPKAGLDVDYLCYSLMFYKVDGMVNGATRQKLTQAAMRKMKIPSRSMKEQLHIVDELNRILKIKEQRQQELTLLDALIKARFVELFGDLKPTTTIARYISELRGGKSLAGTEECKNKVLKTGASTFGWFDPEQYKYLPTDYEPLPEHKVETGDVIISRMNTPELVGACSYVFEAPEDMYYPDRLWKVIPQAETNPIFLWQLLWDREIRRQIKEKSGGTSGTMHNISKPKLLEIKCIDAPIEFQEQFADFVKQVDKSKVAVQKALDETQILFDSLMQKYFG